MGESKSFPQIFMNKKIIKIAEKKANSLIEKYDGFNNIVLDNWRGYRFIYDTDNFLKNKLDGKKYRLSTILKNEKVTKYFNGGLLLATNKDKKIFGQQKYLNTKTLQQYKNCYLNFIKQIETKKEVEKELFLVRNFKIIYVVNGERRKLEKRLKKEILESDIVKNKISTLAN